MTSFLKEMETIIKENGKLKEENKKLKGENECQSLHNENIKLRVQLNEKNREIDETLIILDKYKQDKISRGKKIGSLIKEISDWRLNNLSQIIAKDKLRTEKDKLRIEKENLEINYVRRGESVSEEIDKRHKLQTELSKYINQQEQLKKWFEENCDSFNYRLGKELYDIIN
jgi:hypothetical protein